MIALVSPAKSLDFENRKDRDHTLPLFQKEALTLIDKLKSKSEKDIQQLMSLSEKLALLNVERYDNFTKKKDPAHAKQAVFAFRGDVYQGLEADDFSKSDLNFAQQHFRILSGLYGVLRPLDLIQPYRLEMGTKLSVNGNKNLYEFWGDKITKALNKALADQGDDIIINLASKEYFKSVKTNKLDGQVIAVDFLDYKSGKYKTIAFYAKKARGLMSRYVIKNKIKNADDLKGFDLEGYVYDDNASSKTKFVFKRG